MGDGLSSLWGAPWGPLSGTGEGPGLEGSNKERTDLNSLAFFPFFFFFFFRAFLDYKLGLMCPGRGGEGMGHLPAGAQGPLSGAGEGPGLEGSNQKRTDLNSLAFFFP